MGITERRERERDQTRAKIMNAARELFAREGYDAVSMRKIAEAIEYSPTAIYVHFKDKEDLFGELCREDFGRLSDAFKELAQVKDPVERIRRLGDNYVRFAIQYPNHYRLMFMTSHVHAAGEEIQCGKGNPDEDGYAFLRAAVTEAIEQDRFRRAFENIELATQTLWAMAHGIASLQITKGNDPWVDWRPIDERATAGLDAILRGMLADATSAKPSRKMRKAGAR
jgi:AcrR family transcriptional regulator